MALCASKPRLAERIIERTLPDLPQGRVWVAADEVYGRDGRFRAFLEAHRLPYAVTVQANQTVLPHPGWRYIARLVDRAAAEQDRVELPAGPSPFHSRVWEWWVRRVPDPDTEAGGGAWARWIIARRRADDPGGRDYFLAWGPEETPVEELVGVPGARWRVEEAIRLATSACGLADYEVRSYGGRYRHISLAMLAAAFLAVHDARAVRGTTGPAVPPDQRGGVPDHSRSIGPVRFTAYEIGRLLVLVQSRPHTASGSGGAWPGRTGGGATRPSPAPATSDTTAPARPPPRPS
ncbi:hypothetical protein GCM10009799_02240 [Nocardiopsis rhodophaea]|uniref:Transposase n=1 Tax=Nocardiopsis rhodophaea TaxID=280238 RepID=A0ABN2S5H4_9ACTN